METDSSPSPPPPPPPVDPKVVSLPPPPALPPSLPPLATLTFSDDHAHYRKALEVWRYRVDNPSSEGGWALEVQWYQLNRGEEPFELRAGVFGIAGNPHPPPPGAVYYKPVKLDDLWDIYEGVEPHPFIMGMLSTVEVKAYRNKKDRAGASDASVSLFADLYNQTEGDRTLLTHCVGSIIQIWSRSIRSETDGMDDLLNQFKDRISEVSSLFPSLGGEAPIIQCLSENLSRRPFGTIYSLVRMARDGSDLLSADAGSLHDLEPPSTAPPSTMGN